MCAYQVHISTNGASFGEGDKIYHSDHTEKIKQS